MKTYNPFLHDWEQLKSLEQLDMINDHKDESEIWKNIKNTSIFNKNTSRGGTKCYPCQSVRMHVLKLASVLSRKFASTSCYETFTQC